MNGEPSRQPSKASKTNLVLAAVLVVVCGAAYWLEVQKKPQLKRESDQSSRLLAIDESSEVESVKIVDADKGISVDLACRAHCKLSEPNAEWEITAPIKFRADEANVGTFITGLLAANIQETLTLDGPDSEKQMQEFGLGKVRREQRKAVIKFKKDAEPLTIYFGDNAAVGENMYVYLTGPNQKKDVVRIVPGYIRNNLDRTLSYWRSKRLFDFAASEIEGLVLKNPAGTVELTRKDANWYLAGGKLADNEAVDTFITGLVFMNAQDYVSDDKNKDRDKFGMPASKPHYSLTIKVAKRPDVKLEVYDVLRDKEPRLYAILGDKDFIVQLDRLNSEKFAKKADAFRFRNLLTAAEKTQVTKVTVKLGKKETLELTDPEKFGPALTKVGAARIAEFLGRKPVPSDVPELSSWTLADKDGKKLREFTIYGSAGKGDYYVKLSTGEVGKLERGSGSAVPSKPSDFQAAKASQK